MKCMKLSTYFEIKKPTYSVLQVIPHSSCRNYNSSTIGKFVASMKRDIHREEKRFVIESEVKCSYIIDILKNDVRFYFVVPERYENILKAKITDTWPKATIKDDIKIDSFSIDSVIHTLEYKYDDALSLNIDKRSNALINSTLNVLDIMQDDDRVTLVFDMSPCSNYGWATKAKNTIDNYKSGILIPHNSGLGGYIHLITRCINLILELTMQVINEFVGTNKKEYKHIENKATLSQLTLSKVNETIINTKIAVVSYSQDEFRKKNNALSVCNSFYALEGDNKFEHVRVKDISKLKNNKLCVNETSGLIQVPGKELLENHNINHVEVTETKVPDELLKGYIKAGKSTYKGNTVQTYFSADKEIANLPVILLGPMGAGKTFQNTQYAKDVIAAGEGLICIDYIKSCELASSIEAITPKDRLIVLDLTQESCLQAFAYNEYKITGDTAFERIESANLHQQEVTALIDAVYTGEPLSGQMRKFFTSAADIVLINDGMSLRDIIRVLENHQTRIEFINKIPQEYMKYLEDQVETLKQLNEISKDTGDIVGTKYSKIEHIMDRINSLREDIRMRTMFNKPASYNIDFSKCMNEGKVILIKMRADKFRSKHVRNVLTTFFISKIWLACNIRGASQDKPLRYHVLLDEIFQAPTSYATLDNILRECRKFQLRLVFTAHQLADLRQLNSGLKSAGASYILMQKTDKANFEMLKEEFNQRGFIIDDLLNLKRHHALNLISYSDGYAAYESNLYIN